MQNCSSPLYLSQRGRWQMASAIPQPQYLLTVLSVLKIICPTLAKQLLAPIICFLAPNKQSLHYLYFKMFSELSHLITGMLCSFVSVYTILFLYGSPSIARNRYDILSEQKFSNKKVRIFSQQIFFFVS